MTSCLGENMFWFIYIGELDPKGLENDAKVFLKVVWHKVLNDCRLNDEELEREQYGGFPWAVSWRPKLILYEDS